MHHEKILKNRENKFFSSSDDLAGLLIVRPVLLYECCAAVGLTRNRVEVLLYGQTSKYSMSSAVFRELCSVWMCVPEVSLERHAGDIPKEMQEWEGIQKCSGFMSQSGKLQECLSSRS